MSLIWPDYIIIAIIAISTVISLFRGFVRESLALAGWILAIWVSVMFMNQMAVFITPYLDLPPSLISLISFAVLFILTLIVTALLTSIIGSIVDQTGLSGTDRSIGMIFGLARGAILVAIVILLAGFTAIPQDPWWKESSLIPHFQQLADILKGFLPPHIAAKIHY